MPLKLKTFADHYRLLLAMGAGCFTAPFRKLVLIPIVLSCLDLDCLVFATDAGICRRSAARWKRAPLDDLSQQICSSRRLERLRRAVLE
ncbi:hypothetical protein C8J56DRAFT_1066954 [Mycena floridula]|nr:hypothetical protein C8J56DRAFT_1066954 [Mycena floridula]